MCTRGYGSIAYTNNEALPLAKERRDDPIHEGASLWSKLVFGWFGPLLELGVAKNQLDPEDLEKIPLPPDCATDSVATDFYRCWQRELREEADPSLVRSIWNAFGRDFVRAGALKLVHDCCIFVGPQVLNGLIYFLRDPDETIWTGISLTAAVTMSQLCMSFCLRHYFFKCYLTGLRIRTSVVVAVYKKALVLASSERQTRTVGEIMNLMSIDAQRMQDLTSYLHAVWYSFVQIGLAMFFLWQQLGASCLAGVVVIVIMMPVTRYVAKWMGGIQKRLMKARDERVELNNEVIGSMKVIKLQAWEETFQERILGLRNTELRVLFRYMLASSLTVMLWSSVPLLVALSTFAAYTISGNELEVASALTALALFEILRFPLFMLPQIINNMVEASVSINRVRSFLLAKEHHPIGSGNLSDVGVEIHNATYVYDSKKPKVESDDVKDKGLVDAKWELTLLKSQLADAEKRIEELVKQSIHDNADIDVSAHNSSDSLLCLRRINFECNRGEMIAVVGAVGAGKSSLLNAILGEVRALKGTTSVKGQLAYFAQSPFIMNATVKENIVFGHVGEPFNEERYRQALSTCALGRDLKLLPHGDRTEIGEKGITLSGGQKARVSMARAVYHDADIYLLDDPLAAVDAHVGKHIFQKCIVSQLLLRKGSMNIKSNRKNTIILVTNAVQYLNSPFVDKIVILKDGCVAEAGTYAELSSNANSLFAGFLSALVETGTSSAPEARSGISPSPSLSSLSGLLDVTNNETNQEETLPPKAVPLHREYVKEDGDKIKNPVRADTLLKQAPSSKLMTDEAQERSIGHVDKKVYLAWATAAGGAWVAVAIILAYGGVEVINVASKWWLTYWSERGGERASQMRFLTIYAVINLSTVVATFLRVFLLVLSGLRASKKLFEDVLDVILRAPMSFFDTTPTGRIINRFSKDMYTVDQQLVATVRSYLATLFSVASTVIVISGITPVFTACLVPIIGFYLLQQKYFTITYRELKRLDSVSRSPLYALLGETLEGVATIRAYCSEGTLETRLKSMVDRQQNAYFLTCTAQCWLAVRLELAGTMIITFACICAISEHGSRGGDETYAGLAGLAISFALSVTQSLNWSVRMGSDFEANMVAVERIRQYCAVPSEAPRKMARDSLVGPLWPSSGQIEFRNATLRYRAGLPLVLRGLDLVVPSRAKVGVVGRTGAGKSTLMVAMMRIVELDSGSIVIDGVDIRSVGLATLRSTIAVIPQDPVLFSGSVRTNLDPFGEYSDERLLEVITRVGLHVPGSENGVLDSKGQINSLSDEVSEGGTNFSVGQRQLLVIARALLYGARVVIMDEATAAVDADTDARIQRVIRTEFVNATVLCVAHRLNTIMDSDYILVMDDGHAAEFDTPATLLQRGGLFADLVEAWDNEDA